MRFALVPVLIAIAVPLAAADEKSDADLKALVGKWKLEKAEIGGADQLEHLKSLSLEIAAGGKYTVSFGNQKDEGTFTVDPAKTPKQMDIKGTNGPNKDKTIKAIYKIDGDTLTMCYELGGDARPAKFESKPDTKQFLAVYKRTK